MNTNEKLPNQNFNLPLGELACFVQVKSHDLHKPQAFEITAAAFNPRSNIVYFVRALPRSGPENAHQEVQDISGLSFREGVLRFEGYVRGKLFRFEDLMQEASPTAFWTLFHQYKPLPGHFRRVAFQKPEFQQHLGELGIRFFDVDHQIYLTAPVLFCTAEA